MSELIHFLAVVIVLFERVLSPLILALEAASSWAEAHWPPLLVMSAAALCLAAIAERLKTNVSDAMPW